MCPREPFGEEVQAGLAIPELLQCPDRGNDIVTVGAGLAVPLAHVVQLLLERKSAGVLRMPAATV